MGKDTVTIVLRNKAKQVTGKSTKILWTPGLRGPVNDEEPLTPVATQKGEVCQPRTHDEPDNPTASLLDVWAWAIGAGLTTEADLRVKANYGEDLKGRHKGRKSIKASPSRELNQVSAYWATVDPAGCKAAMLNDTHDAGVKGLHQDICTRNDGTYPTSLGLLDTLMHEALGIEGTSE